jgi:hypothetical protein
VAVAETTSVIDEPLGRPDRMTASGSRKRLRSVQAFVLRRRRSRIGAIAAIVGVLVMAVLVTDLVAFYVLGLRRLGYGSDRYSQSSTLLGFDYRPSTEGFWYPFKDGTRTYVRVNAHGFPDTERSITKTRKRIALMGDHAVEFWEVQEEQRGQYVMERLLDGRVEVLNCGLRGAGTDLELIRFRNQVLLFSPDVVVLLFTVKNLADNVVTDSKPYFVLDAGAPRGIRLEGIPVHSRPPAAAGSSIRHLLEQSFVLRTLKYRFAGIGTQFRADVPLDDHLELRPFKRNYNAEDQRRLELEKRLLRAFAEDARERNIRFLLVEGLYRPALDDAMRRVVFDAYGDIFDFDKMSRIFTEHSVASGYDFLSLPRLVRERRIGVRGLMHPEDAMHFNAPGVRLFADAVVERIRQRRWLDDVLDGEAP